MRKGYQTEQHPIIEARHLGFSYGATPVLADCTFTIHAGDFVALVGDNGAGKSTLIRLLIGELDPSSGSIELMGVKSSHFRSWRQIGYVPQEDTVKLAGFPATVEEVVRTGLYASRGMWRPYGKAERLAVADALEATHVTGLEKRLIGDLSGGQRRRVLLSRALVGKAELLILDEPTAGVDETGSESFFGMLAHLVAQTGLTVLMVTHDLAHARAYADQLLLLSGGIVRPIEQPYAEQGGIRV